MIRTCTSRSNPNRCRSTTAWGTARPIAVPAWQVGTVHGPWARLMEGQHRYGWSIDGGCWPKEPRWQRDRASRAAGMRVGIVSGLMQDPPPPWLEKDDPRVRAYQAAIVPPTLDEEINLDGRLCEAARQALQAGIEPCDHDWSTLRDSALLAWVRSHCTYRPESELLLAMAIGWTMLRLAEERRPRR